MAMRVFGGPDLELIPRYRAALGVGVDPCDHLDCCGYYRGQVGGQPTRVRINRRHRRGRPRRAVPGEAFLGSRSSPTRSTRGSTCSNWRRRGTSRRGRATRPRQGAVPVAARDGSSQLDGHVLGRVTGRTSATSTSSARWVPRARRSRGAPEVPGLRLRGNVWVSEEVDIWEARGCSKARRSRPHCRIADGASIGPYLVPLRGV